MSKINRQDILTRLEKVREKLEYSSNVPVENQRHILEERARKLAAPDPVKESIESVLQVVEFSLAEETYALECRFIKEVFPVKSITPIPGTPAFVLGIINVRGTIVPVIDLKSFFQLPSKGLNDLTRVIILENSHMTFGVLAEEVTGSSDVPLSGIQPSLPTLTGVRADFLKGIAENRLIILDAEKLLNDKKIIVNQEMEKSK
ncbi:MAG: purine-binding chemotaxis protein CheW [bacterium]|nr:purine-binding chemotaxis protein CheW [bacterium]